VTVRIYKHFNILGVEPYTKVIYRYGER
jgi:hypothetical protein